MNAANPKNPNDRPRDQRRPPRIWRLRAARRRRQGVEVIELALLLPILLMMGLFACQFAFYFYIQHNAQAAAREGARAGIPFGATQTDATAKVEGYLTSSGLDPADFTISFSHDVGTAAAGTDITVTVEATWSTVGIDLNGYGPIDSDKVIRGRAVMRKEG